MMRPSTICHLGDHLRWRSRLLCVVLAGLMGPGCAGADQPKPEVTGHIGNRPPTADTAPAPVATIRPKQFVRPDLDPSTRSLSSLDRVPGMARTPVTVDWWRADLHQVLRFLAETGDINIVVDPDVRGEVTVTAREIPADRLLLSVLRAQGLGFSLRGNIMRVVRSGEVSPR